MMDLTTGAKGILDSARLNPTPETLRRHAHLLAGTLDLVPPEDTFALLLAAAERLEDDLTPGGRVRRAAELLAPLAPGLGSGVGVRIGFVAVNRHDVPAGVWDWLVEQGAPVEHTESDEGIIESRSRWIDGVEISAQRMLLEDR